MELKKNSPSVTNLTFKTDRICVILKICDLLFMFLVGSSIVSVWVQSDENHILSGVFKISFFVNKINQFNF